MPWPRVTISAGEHGRDECPVWLTDSADLPDEPLVLVDETTGTRMPLQRVGDRLAFILNGARRGEARRYQVEAGTAEAAGVTVSESDRGLDVTIAGKPFTSY